MANAEEPAEEPIEVVESDVSWDYGEDDEPEPEGPSWRISEEPPALDGGADDV